MHWRRMRQRTGNPPQLAGSGHCPCRGRIERFLRKRGANAHSTTTSASLGLTTNSVDFGNVSVGGSKTQSITLTNSSASDGPTITVTQVGTTGTGFSAKTSALPVDHRAGRQSGDQRHICAQIRWGRFREPGYLRGRSNGPGDRDLERDRRGFDPVGGFAFHFELRKRDRRRQQEPDWHADRGKQQHQGFFRLLERKRLFGQRNQISGNHLARERASPTP